MPGSTGGTPTYRIRNWHKHQARLDRKPIFVKMYLALLSDRHWRRLPGDSAKFLIDLILLAGNENKEGRLPSIADISYDIRMSEDEVRGHLVTLIGHEFVEVGNHPAPIGRETGADSQPPGNHPATDGREMVALARSREVEKEEEVEEEDAREDRALVVDEFSVEHFCEQTGVKWELKAKPADWLKGIQAEYPDVDVPSELRACADWWESQGSVGRKTLKAPSRAIRNWMNNRVRFDKKDAREDDRDTGTDFDPQAMESV